MWLSLVERCVRDAKAAGSNPVIPTSINNQPIEISTFQWVFCFPGYPGIHEFPDHEKNDPDLDFLLLMGCSFLHEFPFFGSVKNVGVEDTPRISEPLSFFEKTLFSSAPTGVSHR